MSAFASSAPAALLAIIATVGLGSSAARAAIDPGEILIGEMNCAACHEAAEPVKSRLAARQSPKVGPDGVRLSPTWLRAFLEDPQAVQPGTLMPDMLAALDPAQRAATADALTQYLISLQKADASATPAATAAEIKTGQTLYHAVGCVACHAPFELPPGVEKTAATSEELGQLAAAAVPLGDVAKKYPIGELAAFLRDPLKTRPSGRMPSLKLSETEAHTIAAYLLRNQQRADAPAEFVVDPQKAARGRFAYEELQCAKCHGSLENAWDKSPQIPKARPLAKLTGRQPAGCLSPKARPGIPKFDLTDRQRVVILAQLGAQTLLSEPLTPEQQITRTMTVLNCFACHVRGRRGGTDGLKRAYFTSLDPAATDDAARIPPSLTGIGARLKPDAIAAALWKGTTAHPTMATRMPQSGEANVRALPALFEMADTPATK